MSAIEEVSALIERRVGEIDAERQKLHSALKELSGGTAPKRSGRPRGSGSAPQGASVTSGPKRRRSRKGGTRSDDALSFIEKNPGSTANQVAEELKINPNYVYRVLGDLTKEGKLRKEGRAYWATK